MLRKTLAAALLASALSIPAHAADGTLKIVSVDVEGGGGTLFVTPEGTSLLIDTGWPTGAGLLPSPDGARNSADRIVAAAKKLGVSKIDYLIITHYHMDHVGGLLVDGVKERLRPDVRIHVSATEVAFWTSPDFSHTVMPKPVPAVLRSTAASFYNEYRDRLRIFQDRHEVAPGVVVRTHMGMGAPPRAGHSDHRQGAAAHRPGAAAAPDRSHQDRQHAPPRRPAARPRMAQYGRPDTHLGCTGAAGMINSRKGDEFFCEKINTEPPGG